MKRLLIALLVIMFLAVSDFNAPGVRVQAFGTLNKKPIPTAGCIPSNNRPKKCPTFTPTSTKTKTPTNIPTNTLVAPTNTPTNTPTDTATPTPTNTP